METKIFIPKKIKVGYQERDDTYSKKLAYIIYYDNKGKLRKETSWEDWRDKKVKPEEFDNTPQSGLVLNKDIKRYNWSHFSSRRTMIRVYDPRGIEFEITTENLIGILMNSDCSKRNLSGEYVYAWDGPELVLLPCSCEEYEKAANFTSLQDGKISAKDLVPGCSYKTKREGDLIYVGRYMWYETDWYKKKDRKGKKQHIFYNETPGPYYEKEGGYFIIKSDVSFLALKNSDEIVSNFAQIIDKFTQNIKSSDIVKWELVPTEVSLKTNNTTHNGPSLIKTDYFIKNLDIITQYDVASFNLYNNETKKYEQKGFEITAEKSISVETKKVERMSYDSYLGHGYANHWGYKRNPTYQEKDLHGMGFCDLFVTLENGKRIQIDDLEKL